MGIIGKLAGKAVKNIAISAASVLYDKNYENIKKAHDNQSRIEKSYPRLSGYTIFTIDKYIQTPFGRAVRDESGTILYHIKEKSSGKCFEIYSKDGAELSCISAARGNRSIVRHLNEKRGEVRGNLSFTGFFYAVSWLNWRIETNLLDTERTCFMCDQEIAKAKFFAFGQDSHLIYAKNMPDLENFLIASFSIDAIKTYNGEHASSAVYNQKERKTEKTSYSKPRKSRRKIDWDKLAGKGDYWGDDDDD